MSQLPSGCATYAVILPWTECLEPPQIHVGNLILSVMVFGRGAFKKRLGHEGGALLSGVSALIKKDPRKIAGPFSHVKL